MKKRFLMYFGCYDLSYFRAYLDGHFRCKQDYNIVLNNFDEKILTFTENIECKEIPFQNEFVTWDRKYRIGKDWQSWGQAEAGQKIIESFWGDLENHLEEKL